MRKINFSAGPSVLPDEVFEQMAAAMTDFEGSGLSIAEISHRSKEFTAVIEEGESLVRELLSVPDDYSVLFLQGGASLQFLMVPMNLMKTDGYAAYLDSGTWASKALKEASGIGRTVCVASSKESNYTYVPKNYTIPSDADYFHCTSNNTIFGTQMKSFPQSPVPMACDMSSDIFSRRIDVSRFGLIYAGAQKNIGPAGLTVVIMRRELAENPDPNLPIMLQYKTFTKHKSLYNTPPVFAVYIMGKVLKWIKKNGGLAGMAAHNEAKAKLIYDVIDSYPDFYKGHAAPDSRSLMNITFRLPDEELEAEFVKQSQAAGMSGLKGHRSVGGLRASIYNGMPMAGCKALAEFMLEFMKKSA